LSLITTGTGLGQVTPSDTSEIQGPPSPFEPLPANWPLAGMTEPSTFPRISRWHNDVLSWETGAGRTYVLPAAEILAYEFLLNLFDRHFVEPKEDYQTN